MTKKERMQQILDSLEHLQDERSKLHLDLKKSLCIEELFPDAFAHGSCHSVVRGNVLNKTMPLTFVLKFGNGEERSIPLEEVPVLLWPEQVKDSVRKARFSNHGFKYWKRLHEYEKERRA